MKCKNCCYYTGTKCHGHGEYWGECMLVSMAYKELGRKQDENHYVTAEWNDARYDESNCIFKEKQILKVKEFKK